MPEILIDGKPFDYNDDNHVAVVTKGLVTAVDPEAAKAIDEIGDSKELIKRVFAPKSGSLDIEKAEKAFEVFNAGFDTLSRSITKLSSSMVNENRANSYDAARQAIIARGYNASGSQYGSIEIPDEVRAEMSREFGWDAVDMATSPAIMRAMRAPISVKDDSKAAILHGRDLVTRAMLVSAYMPDAVQRSSVEGEPAIINTETLLHNMKKIAASSNGEASFHAGQMVLREAGFLSGGNTGYGAEHMPIIPSSELITEIWMETKVAQQFPRFPMSRSSVKLPRLNGRGYAYKSVRPTQQAQYYSQIVKMSGVGSDSVQFDAVDIARLIMWDSQFEDDVLYALSGELMRLVISSMAFAKDDAIMNGNTDLATMDNAAADGSRLFANENETTAYWKTNTKELDVRSAFNGLRYKALVADPTTVDFSGTVNGSDAGETFLANFVKMIGKLGKFGDNQSNLRCFTGLHSALPLLTCSKFTTVDKLGSQATLLTGMLGSIFDVPIIKTEVCYDRLAATGLYAGSSSISFGTYIMTKPDLWRIGVREDVTIYSEKNRLSGASAILATERLDFKQYQTSSDSTDHVIAAGIQTQVY